MMSQRFMGPRSTGDVICPQVGFSRLRNFGRAEVIVIEGINHAFQQIAKYVLGKSEA